MNKFHSIILISLLSTNVYSKVTDADVDRDMNHLANQNNFIGKLNVTQQEVDDQWRLFNKPPQEPNNTDNWELRVWTSITRGGRYGYVTRTWFGKFDKKTGRFLGYINQHEESDSINGPHWQ
ncbi:hypothetical protein VXS05_17170 [Photobacterium toruni]|uniref:hypothetical protein n=1 Tax=Photobacterium toruni TaxID=1935446 RepID=UPI002E16B795|nr:hypothetical protein [Photobacterium toruni]